LVFATKLLGVRSQKTAILILTTVRTPNPQFRNSLGLYLQTDRDAFPFKYLKLTIQNHLLNYNLTYAVDSEW
jgi:hypothetical protein